MITCAKRSLALFFRDKATLLFSLLSVFIVIMLYALFLGDIWKNESTLAGVAGRDALMDSWLSAGLLAIASLTTTLGAFSIMVEDRAKKIYKDFYVAPLRRSAITGGYLLGALCVGLIMGAITLLVTQVYIVLRGGALLPLLGYVKVLALLLVSSAANTALVCFIVSFLKTSSSFTTTCVTIGTLSGFVMGIYLPIGNLPAAVQTGIKLFPPSHAAMLFRQVLMEAPIATSFAGAPPALLAPFNEFMGITFRFGDTTLTPLLSILYLLASAALFFTLAVANMSRKRR